MVVNSESVYSMLALWPDSLALFSIPNPQKIMPPVPVLPVQYYRHTMASALWFGLGLLGLAVIFLWDYWLCLSCPDWLELTIKKKKAGLTDITIKIMTWHGGGVVCYITCCNEMKCECFVHLFNEKTWFVFCECVKHFHSEFLLDNSQTFSMFSSKSQLKKRTPENGTDRENFLSLLVDEYLQSSSYGNLILLPLFGSSL